MGRMKWFRFIEIYWSNSFGPRLLFRGFILATNGKKMREKVGNIWKGTSYLVDATAFFDEKRETHESQEKSNVWMG